MVSLVCDRALLKLLRESDRDVMFAHRDSESINFTTGNNLDLPTQQRRNADD
ncbi:hypothetical protein [Anabaena azotica]|uniref:hypothetical protein n=1 Tax=Anabaena azotica TaxID=197653 RepID=UPI0039A6E123